MILLMVGILFAFTYEYHNMCEDFVVFLFLCSLFELFFEGLVIVDQFIGCGV